VLELGDPAAPTVVLVHGYPDAKEMWLDVMERLRERFHVVAYDVRGAGGSDAPRRSASYDFERLGDDLLAVLDRVSGGRAGQPGRAAHLVGHDWGGLQGWEFATQPRFEGRLASFTGVAGPMLDQVALTSQALLRERRMLEWLRRGRRSWYILTLLPRGLPPVTWRLLAARGRWQRALRDLDGLPEERQYPHPTLVRDAVNGANLYRRNILRRTLRPRSDARAHVPVQLIVPTGDRYIPLGYYDRAAEHAPVLRRHDVPGGHWLPRADPDLVARLVGEFVYEVEAS
jgi:pimeloyl-ACP methyl ester carboxylesterase